MHHKAIKCHNCALASVCLPVSLTKSDIESLEASVVKQKSFGRGDFLSYCNDTLTHLYAVRSGSFKSVQVDAEGNQQILEFYLPGELIGLDCLAESRFHYDLIALDQSSVCEVSKEKLFSMASESSNFQRYLFGLVSKNIQEYQKFHHKVTAEEKVAMFLFALIKRYRNLDPKGKDFKLPMSRNDIGNYLGLAAETITRIFKNFEKENLVKFENRNVKIIDEEKLKKLCPC